MFHISYNSRGVTPSKTMHCAILAQIFVFWIKRVYHPNFLTNLRTNYLAVWKVYTDVAWCKIVTYAFSDHREYILLIRTVTLFSKYIFFNSYEEKILIFAVRTNTRLVDYLHVQADKQKYNYILVL